ncbi:MULTISPECIES: putative polysaccharide biosynthesis protein [Enterococcus]|uniref:putative polysaccharide biosynthesis protein n=1 Tax=Enterococcus TaxID=1350 RepID=UPI00065E5435|nr:MULTISPECIES: oligosaccharide flippase family protein [Enterococcus]KAF1304476.1 polysaccharide biosynthesis protein [Enterococcus sp. JM9B]
MAKNQMKTVMQGAFVLTLASFVAKLLSAVYRVPFQNVVGDEGFYVYQQVYPIYGMAMTLALSGLPQFISKYIAEKPTLKAQREGMEKLYPLVLWTSVLLWGATFFGAGAFAYLMGNAQLAVLIRVVSFAFLLVAPLAFYRGNFQGNLQMVPSAVSQVVEQLLRVSVILLAAWAFRHFGLSIYQTGTIAMLGAVVGGSAAWLILAHYEKKIHGRTLGLNRLPLFSPQDPDLRRRFLIEGGLLFIYSGLLILFQLIDSFVITNALETYGLTQQAARIAKGVYDRGQPLVQLGLVAATALSSTFLPALTGYLHQENQRLFRNSAKIYLRLTASIALAASVGLVLLLPYVNFALFKDFSGNETLTLFVFSVFLMGMIQAYQSIAQSKNRFRTSIQAAGLGLLVKCIATWGLTALFGTVGASLGTLAGLAIVLQRLIKKEDARLNAFWRERKFGRTLIFCIGIMICSILVYYSGVAFLFGNVQHRLQALGISVVGVAIGVVFFIGSAIRLRLFTVREWLLLPFGKKILRFKRS